ncbi:TPA: oligosaccharide repeat unit polymerase [Enterobacter hormaechei]|uniref:oligosaccharide repeat unit polymerase n=1 Tax=Enterobacter hormaechei TaxID=158836 RepID=UPI00285BE1D9|nr:oligosaccharide repeat unit polymerase [Enterobacter hormaechei]ELD3466230.1 oligosaccharide repeat unit polymerase [Enterobacter hormaechei]MED5732664.1 oligosaccharide repeat unit polymerase [Enterobacter hormaechei]HBM2513074.1 oligosaccharide repeat unit polymerase [Enterobacter hormaechei]HBM2518992.1 oligosaccharide repeat unit polymerase [Enterobacter hormaechei]HBM2531891.1 oligosaccharide repeat unit polymerase [Enterobacter hormaechei]
MSFIEQNQALLIRRYFLTIYLFFNVVCGFYFIYDGKLGGDFQGEYPTEPTLMFIAIIIVLSIFYFILSFLFSFFEKIRVRELPYCRSNLLDYFVVILLSLSIHAAINLNVGISGLKLDEPDGSSKFYFFLISIFQPVNFALIYLFYRTVPLRVNKVFLLNIFLYVVYVIVSAQTINILTMFALFIIYLNLKQVKVSGRKLFTLTALGLAIYPVIRFLKYAIVSSGRQNVELASTFQNNISDGVVEMYFDFFFKSIERFQMVANIQFIMERWEALSYAYNNAVNGEYSFLSSYWFIDAVLRRVFGENVFATGVAPQDFMATAINGQDTWSSHISFLGYIPFFGFYSIVVYTLMIIFIFLSILLSRKLMSSRYFLTLAWLMCLFLVCHGWFIPFINYIQSLLVFIFVIMTLQVFNVGRKQIQPRR